MDLADLQQHALSLADAYDRHNTARGQPRWSACDLALGLTGDVGDLAKLVMALEGRRDGGTDVQQRLGHELADCLWSVLVLADRCGVDLTAEFTGMVQQVRERLGAETPR